MIRIGRLHLRLRGVPPRAARATADDVGRRLLREVADRGLAGRRRIETLHVVAPRDRIARSVTDAIEASLQRGRNA